MAITALRHAKPGDILVMAIPEGFLLGRRLLELGPGRWWEYIKTMRDEHVAMKEALRLARRAHVRAWLYRDSDEEVPIPSKQSRPLHPNDRWGRGRGR